MGNEVRVLITAKDSASSDINKVKQAGFDLGDAMTKASLVGVAGMAAIGVGSIKLAADFQKGISDVGAIAGATKDEMSGLSDTALRIGKDTAYSAGEATAAMKELASGGISVKDIMGGAADAAVNLAAAGGTDLATAANVAASALSVWGLKTSDLNKVVNETAGAANVSKFGVEDMSLAIAQGGGVAAAAGVNYEDFSATIAAVAPAFSSGSDAGTSFKTFLISLANPTDKAATAMKEIGFSAYDAQGNLKSMKDMVQNLHDSLGPLDRTAEGAGGGHHLRHGLDEDRGHAGEDDGRPVRQSFPRRCRTPTPARSPRSGWTTSTASSSR
jgi:TP901 family phage tail tape measure protein